MAHQITNERDTFVYKDTRTSTHIRYTYYVAFKWWIIQLPQQIFYRVTHSYPHTLVKMPLQPPQTKVKDIERQATKSHQDASHDLSRSVGRTVGGVHLVAIMDLCDAIACICEYLWWWATRCS